ncbi:YdcF family protein [Soonwooa sp.]|uniref:YdcF family protein n=1 Tax=Soonwooa sp. TaxID=1938592 RepID=UPI0026177B5B|nr:YdcF family protein [Soonwooa sp.]
MKKVLKIVLGLLLAWFVLHCLYITYDGLHDKKQNAEVAIVLGNKINEDGMPSPRLKARLDKSVELYQDKRVNEILVSGGLGKEGFWEANEMKKYLVAQNIPSEKILVDNYGDDTEKTVKNSIRIVDSLGYKSAISVSQYFHQTRTKALFKKDGFKNIESVSPDYFELRDLYSLFREFVAYYKEVIFG